MISFFKNIRATITQKLTRVISINKLAHSELVKHFEEKTVYLPQAKTLPFVESAKHLNKESYVVSGGSSRRLNKVYFLSNNLLFSASRKIIAESSSTYREPSDLYWRNQLTRKKKHIVGCCTSLRSIHNNYYHTLIDNLPRLFLLHSPLYANEKISLLLPSKPSDVESFFLEKLCPENVTIQLVDEQTFYSCDSFIFTDFLSKRFSGYLPQEYLQFFFSKVLPMRPRHKKHKIYISRKKADNMRSIINEESLMKALAPLGYKMHTLENLDIQSQVDLFYDAQSVISAHGAGLTNLLFSEHAQVIELHPMQTFYPHYYFLCQSLNHDYQNWCANEGNKNSDFTVDVDAVLALLTGEGKSL